MVLMGYMCGMISVIAFLIGISYYVEFFSIRIKKYILNGTICVIGSIVITLLGSICFIN